MGKYSTMHTKWIMLLIVPDYFNFCMTYCKTKRVALVTRWRCRRGQGWERMGLALVALGKEPKCVDLLDEVGHASPPTEPKSDHQNPHHYKCIHHIHSSPAWHKRWQLLRSILTNNMSIGQVSFECFGYELLVRARRRKMCKLCKL